MFNCVTVIRYLSVRKREMERPQASDFLQFSWRVEASGYKWVQAVPIDLKEGKRWKRGQFLCAAPSTGARRLVTDYNPLRTASGLFKTFAKREPNPELIAAFAKEYGQLGTGVGEMVVMEGESFARWGESYPAWKLELERMRQAVELWDAIESPDLRMLERRIKWEKDGVFYYSHPKRGKKPPGAKLIRIATEAENPQILERILPDDVIEPAKWALQRIINNSLKTGASLQLLFDDGELGLFQAPDSLRSAMWIQLAQAVSGHKKIVKCRHRQCDTWFQVAPGVGRDGKIYCKPACRAAAHRKEQKK